MVGIAQSVERLVVVQKVAGSSPVTHPVQIGMNLKKFMPIFFILLRHANTSCFHGGAAMSNDEHLIREIIHRWADGMHSGDVATVVAGSGPDFSSGKPPVQPSTCWSLGSPQAPM